MQSVIGSLTVVSDQVVDTVKGGVDVNPESGSVRDMQLRLGQKFEGVEHGDHRRRIERAAVEGGRDGTAILPYRHCGVCDGSCLG